MGKWVHWLGLARLHCSGDGQVATNPSQHIGKWLKAGSFTHVRRMGTSNGGPGSMMGLYKLHACLVTPLKRRLSPVLIHDQYLAS